MKLHRKDIKMLLLVTLLRTLDANKVEAAVDLSRSLNLHTRHLAPGARSRTSERRT